MRITEECKKSLSETTTTLEAPLGVDVDNVPHDAGVVCQDDKRPDVLRSAAVLHPPTALQLQIMVGQFFN